MPDSSGPHGLQPTRLLRPWDLPGKSTGVGCHRLLLVDQRGGGESWGQRSLVGSHLWGRTESDTTEVTQQQQQQQCVYVSPKLLIPPTPTLSPLVSRHLASKFSFVLESFSRYSVLYHWHVCLVIFQCYVALLIEGLFYGSILDKAKLFSLSSLLFFSKIFLAVSACLFRRTQS